MVYQRILIFRLSENVALTVLMLIEFCYNEFYSIFYLKKNKNNWIQSVNTFFIVFITGSTVTCLTT